MVSKGCGFLGMTEKTMKEPLILDIKGNSLDDGPGIRSVVFYKGCPLSCVWCHNPESKKASVEISFDKVKCINCGACRKLCPEHALDQGNPCYIDRSRCTLCFECVDVCPSGALKKVGEALSIDSILERVLQDKPFYDTSGGGVTLSGGEPTLYMEFTGKLLRLLKRHGVHTLLETCGYFDLDRFMDMVYPYCDSIYYDIKVIDSSFHREYCGMPNERILGNFSFLSQRARQDGMVLLPRTPLVPDITDTDENIKGIAAFLKAHGITEASLLAYNPLWHEKCDKVGTHDPYKKSKAMTSFPDRSILERCRDLFAHEGITA